MLNSMMMKRTNLIECLEKIPFLVTLLAVLLLLSMATRISKKVFLLNFSEVLRSNLVKWVEVDLGQMSIYV
jgi:hypothetical protein